MYCDKGQHFKNQETISYFTDLGVKLRFSPSGASKSFGMVEVGNRILESVLRKASKKEWDEVLSQSTSELNHRIIPHLGKAPAEILLRINPQSVSASLSLGITPMNSDVDS